MSSQIRGLHIYFATFSNIKHFRNNCRIINIFVRFTGRPKRVSFVRLTLKNVGKFE